MATVLTPWFHHINPTKKRAACRCIRVNGDGTYPGGFPEERCCAAGRRMLTWNHLSEHQSTMRWFPVAGSAFGIPQFWKWGRFKYLANTCSVTGEMENATLWLMTLKAFCRGRAECLTLSPWTSCVSAVLPGNELGAVTVVRSGHSGEVL